MARILTRKSKTRGPRYTAQVRVTGHEQMAKTFGRRADAVAWAVEVEARIRKGEYRDDRDAQNIGFLTILDQYLTTVTPRKKPNTQNRDKTSARALSRHFRWASLQDITPIAVAEYRDARLKTVSPSTLQKELALLSHLLNIARREWGIPVQNAVQAIERPSIGNGRLRFLDRQEVLDLLDACKASRNRLLHPFVLLMLHTGMRPSEAAGLRWSQIDFAHNVVDLTETKSVHNQTRMSGRRVPLTQTAAELIASLRQDDKDHVFLPRDVSSNVLLRSALYFRTGFTNACKRAGIKDFHMHDCRHTAASWLIMSGVDIRTVAEILGHSTLAMTMRYTHLLDQHKKEAIGQLDNLGSPSHGS